MRPLRRSQRLCTQPSGQQHGRADTQVRANGKRKLDEDEGSPQRSKRYRLTEKNLSKHEKEVKGMGRGRKLPAHTLSNSGGTRTATTTTTTDRRFGSALLENGVIFGGPLVVRPDDYDEIKGALAKKQELPPTAHRNWISIQESVYESVWGELSLESKIIEALLGHHEYPLLYERFRNEQWTEVDNEITAGISDPKPDVIESYLLKAYPPGTRDDFGDLVPTQYAYAMPTFAMESKGEGDAKQAMKQAAYDGAVMTHAAIAAECQMGKDEGSLYSKTKAITVTLNPDEICIYANHAKKEPITGTVTYHQCCVERILYSQSEADWNTAHSVLRNAQLFALRLADTRIQDLKTYFAEKEKAVEKLKAKNDRLRLEARARAKSIMMPPPKRVSTMKPSGPDPRTTDNTTKPAATKTNNTRLQNTGKQHEGSTEGAIDQARKTSQRPVRTKSKTSFDPALDRDSANFEQSASFATEAGSKRPANKVGITGPLSARIEHISLGGILASIDR